MNEKRIGIIHHSRHGRKPEKISTKKKKSASKGSYEESENIWKMNSNWYHDKLIEWIELMELNYKVYMVCDACIQDQTNGLTSCPS